MIKLVINENVKKSRIEPEIYGHFSEHLGRCIYEGIYVGEDSDIPNKNGMRTDVVEALKELQVPVLRWPGGCFADEYHWKDGIGPKAWSRTTASAPTSFSSCVTRSAARPISMAMSAREPFRRCRSGSSI